MSRWPRVAKSALAACFALQIAGTAIAVEPQWMDQNWPPADRNTFYTTDQGSRIIDYDWIKALNRPDGGGGFMADGLARYGYLTNSKSATNPEGLPVGFMVGAGVAGDTAHYLAMNCAACHTRQIEVKGQPYRVDGGPAIVDFQSFLADLSAAVRAILITDGPFDSFAHRVLATSYSPQAVEALKLDVTAWYADFGDFMTRSLPPQPWGPTRLDAFGMIFNRVSGRDLDIPDNIKSADAPVRYPFLWNAPFQDRTQWNGAVPNGLFIFGLGRNLGEVYGVFGKFNPHRESIIIPIRFNGGTNSANFVKLQKLEELVFKLRAPRWQTAWGYDAAKAQRGDRLFQNNCAGCHGINASPDVIGAWKTPVKNVGTDERMFANARREAATGILADTTEASMPPQRFGESALEVEILGTAVAKTLLQEFLTPRFPLPNANGAVNAVRRDLKDLGVGFVGENGQALLDARLQNLFNQLPTDPGPSYEARVLNGIWAAAPYLHNGSVPTLWDLLQPQPKRPTKFTVGIPDFDPVHVGLPADSSAHGVEFDVGPCTGSNSGNGNCGHEFGVTLSDDEKWEIIEYIKGLDPPE
jgi:cytochrome c551/c552